MIIEMICALASGFSIKYQVPNAPTNSPPTNPIFIILYFSIIVDKTFKN